MTGFFDNSREVTAYLVADLGLEEPQVVSCSLPENPPPPKRKLHLDWIFICGHVLCCVALALVLALSVNGYNAIDTTTPRYASLLARGVVDHHAPAPALVQHPLGPPVAFHNTCWHGKKLHTYW